MSGPDGRMTGTVHKTDADRAAAARAAVIAADRRRQGAATAVLHAAFAFGAAVREGRLARAVAVARALCIIAAGLIPVVLFWAFAYPG